MIDMADRITGFRAEDYLPYVLRWHYDADPERHLFEDSIDLIATEPEALVAEARLLAQVFLPADADAFVVELGGLGVHEDRRTPEGWSTRI